MSDLEREVREALERAGADDLGKPRAHYRDVEPLPEPVGWGPLSFLQPATPWHLVGIGVLLYFVGTMLGRGSLPQVLVLLGFALAIVGIASLMFLPRSAQPKRWRGRLVNLDDSWRARLYRRIYRR